MKKIVLLIDDDGDEFQILKDAFQRYLPSYSCNWVQKAEEVLDYLEDIIPSLILLDLNMPKINGIDYLLVLKSHEKYRGIPVILYSTTITEQTCKEANRIGALACIQKTADIKSLMVEFEKFFKREDVWVK